MFLPLMPLLVHRRLTLTQVDLVHLAPLLKLQPRDIVDMERALLQVRKEGPRNPLSIN